MIRKTSDYRHSYRPSDAMDLRQSWERNSSYRDLRRQSEHCHTPLSWQDDQEWVDVEDDISEPSTCRRPSSVPIHKYKHEKYNQAYQERMRRVAEAKLSRMSLHDDEGYRSVSTTPSPVTAGKEKTQKKSNGNESKVRNRSSWDDLESSGEYKQKDDVRSTEKKKGMNKTFKVNPRKEERNPKQKFVRPVKPTYKVPLNRSRPKSSPNKGPFTGHIQPPIKHIIEPDFSGKQSPFVPYGSKDEKKKTGDKKTHNVRASAGVYPSALRAMNRRQKLMEEAEEKLRSTMSSPQVIPRVVRNDEWVRTARPLFYVEYPKLERHIETPAPVVDEPYIMKDSRKPLWRRPLPAVRPMSAPLGRSNIYYNALKYRTPSPSRERERWYRPKESHRYRRKKTMLSSRGTQTRWIPQAWEIFPPELRSWQRRKLAIQQREEKRKSAPYREKRRRSLFNDTHARRDSRWDTVYNRSYSGYDTFYY